MKFLKKGIVFILVLSVVIVGFIYLYFYIKHENGARKLTETEKIRKAEERRFKKLKNVFVKISKIEGSRIAKDKKDFIKKLLKGYYEVQFIDKDYMFICIGRVPPPRNYAIKFKKEENIKTSVKNILKEIIVENNKNKDFNKSAEAAPLRLIYDQKPSEIKKFDSSNLPSDWKTLAEFNMNLIKYFKNKNPNYITENEGCEYNKNNAYVISKEKFDSLPITLKGVNMKKHAKPVE